MSLNDTESRLRDYLSDKARVVPDDATPPALTHQTRPATHAAVLPVTARRRSWPALVAAAAVLAVTVPS